MASNKIDPIAMLLNETEILLAQTRLMELYLNQAEADAEDEMARLGEWHEKELTALRTELAALEKNLTQIASKPALTDEIRLQIDLLETQLASERDTLASRDAELKRAKSNADFLRERINQLESAHQQAQVAAGQAVLARQELEGDLDAVKQQLTAQQENLQENQLLGQQIQEKLQSHITQLQSQLASQSEHAAKELDAANHEISALRSRVGDLETTLEQVQDRTIQERAQAESQFDAELDALRSEVEVRERRLRENQSAMIELERELKREIVDLESELEQTRAVAGLRDQDLRANSARVGTLENDLAELATAYRGACAEAEKLAALYRADEDRIAELEYQVEAKEQALSERQEAGTAVELALHERIQALQQDLARNQREFHEREADWNSTRAEAKMLRDRLTDLEAATANAELRAQKLAAVGCKLEGEITAMSARLAQEESTATERENALQSALDSLTSETHQRHQELDEQRRLADQLNREVDRLRLELAAAEEENTRSEQARIGIESHWHQATQDCRELEKRLEAQETELAARLVDVQQANESMLREREETFQDRTEHFQREIKRLRDQVQSQQNAAEHAKAQLDILRSEIAARDARHSATEQVRGELEKRLEQALLLSRNLEARLEIKDQQLRDAESASQIEKLAALGEQEAAFKSLEARWSEEIGQLRAQIQEQRSAAIEAQQELNQRGDAISELKARLQAKDDELNAERDSSADRARQVAAKINDFQCQIADKHLFIESRAAEVAELKAHLGRALEQLAEHEAADRDAKPAIVAELGARERELENNLTEARQTIGELNRQISHLENLQRTSDGQLQKAEHERTEKSRLEQNLRDQIDRLLRETREKNGLLRDRNDELVRVKEEMDQLNERLHQREWAASQAESALAGETDRMRAEFQAQLALLQADLSQKEWALEEQRARAKGLDQAHTQEIERLHEQYRQEIQAMRQSLSGNEPPEKRNRLLLDAQSAEEREARLKKYRKALDVLTENADPAFPASENRRWHSRWKRRWKS